MNRSISAMRSWALSRIRTCREQEQKFCSRPTRGRASTAEMPQAAIEAWTERRALEAVLRMLNAECEHGEREGSACVTCGHSAAIPDANEIARSLR